MATTWDGAIHQGFQRTTWHGAIHEGFKRVTSMIYSTETDRIDEEEVVEDVFKVARFADEQMTQHTSTTKTGEMAEDNKETKKQLGDSDIGDLNSTEFASEDSSLSLCTDDDEALSGGGEAQERAWQSLPESVQKQLKALTPLQRHRAFAVVAVIIVLVLVTGVSVTAARSRGSAPIFINEPMLPPAFNDTTVPPGETATAPTGYPTSRPTRWFSAMTLGPTINTQEYMDGSQQESEQPPTTTKASYSPVYYAPRPPKAPTGAPASPFPTISLHAESVSFNMPPSLRPSEKPHEIETDLDYAWKPISISNLNTHQPSQEPSSLPSTTATPNITYVPGVLSHEEHGLLLSQGLRARILAKSGESVTLLYGINSSIPFHQRPDAGATFADIRPWNNGGMVYVSNAEVRHQDAPGGSYNGGVGAITFDRNGQMIDYSMVLRNTTWNCGGGKTPWNTWISCEETPKVGQCYQVSPFGLRESEVLTVGEDGGRFESFAHDVRNPLEPHFFITEDHAKGALQRFTPFDPDWLYDPWSMLHGNGTIDFLVLEPNDEVTGGTFRWTQDRELAQNNAGIYYPHTEGIDSHGSQLYFVSKHFKQLYELNLDDMTYSSTSTEDGLFDGAPDQLQRIMKTPGTQPRQDDNNLPLEQQDILYFTEEDGKDSGVHGRNANGDYFTILESPVYNDEVTGLAFSPDGMRMYFAYQVDGVLFEVYREDGLPFNAKALDVHYHGSPTIDINEDDDEDGGRP